MPLIAKSPYDNVLTAIGLLENGKISQSGVDAFVDDVALLLTVGNVGGKTLKPISSLFPFPPLPGPLSGPLKQELFWFSATTSAGAIIALKDPKKSPIWHTIFIDTLYQNVAKLLDLQGNTPLFPIFDPSAPFGVELPFPFSQIDLIKAIKTTPPQFLAKLAKSGIKLSLPSLPIPALPSLSPTFVKFDASGIPSLSISPTLPPNPTLELLVGGLIKLPFSVLTSLLVPPQTKLVYDLPNLPKLVTETVFETFLEVLKSVGFNLVTLLPTELIASIMVFLKNVVAILCVVIVSNILGTGTIALGVGKTLGLVKT